MQLYATAGLTGAIPLWRPVCRVVHVTCCVWWKSDVEFDDGPFTQHLKSTWNNHILLRYWIWWGVLFLFTNIESWKGQNERYMNHLHRVNLGKLAVWPVSFGSMGNGRTAWFPASCPPLALCSPMPCSKSHVVMDVLGHLCWMACSCTLVTLGCFPIPKEFPGAVGWLHLL